MTDPFTSGSSVSSVLRHFWSQTSPRSFGFTPAKTPEAIVRRLNEAIVAALGTAESRERFVNAGVEAVGSTPEALGAATRSFTAVASVRRVS